MRDGFGFLILDKKELTQAEDLARNSTETHFEFNHYILNPESALDDRDKRKKVYLQ